eukprot:TRINITY_DN7307_c0_g1_i5.p1 TRINITY_DN7307_c0_g1~~TRINITY_DN7307_c0_g1_i5.p1  ORF type:complete len:277 (+),score=-32.36 TRINITY_DN7307_c0_g1_i5:192-1022(+)
MYDKSKKPHNKKSPSNTFTYFSHTYRGFFQPALLQQRINTTKFNFLKQSQFSEIICFIIKTGIRYQSLAQLFHFWSFSQQSLHHTYPQISQKTHLKFIPQHKSKINQTLSVQEKDYIQLPPKCVPPNLNPYIWYYKHIQFKRSNVRYRIHSLINAQFYTTTYDPILVYICFDQKKISHYIITTNFGSPKILTQLVSICLQVMILQTICNPLKKQNRFIDFKVFGYTLYHILKSKVSVLQQVSCIVHNIYFQSRQKIHIQQNYYLRTNIFTLHKYKM